MDLAYIQQAVVRLKPDPRKCETHLRRILYSDIGPHLFIRVRLGPLEREPG